MSLNFGPIRPRTAELTAPELLKNPCIISLALLIRSSLYLQVKRTAIITWTSLNFDQIRPRTGELAALECLKNL